MEQTLKRRVAFQLYQSHPGKANSRASIGELDLASRLAEPFKSKPRKGVEFWLEVR